MTREALTYFNLCVVNTIVGNCSPTWSHSSGKQSRIDYICCGRDALDKGAAQECLVIEEIDLAVGGRPDHATAAMWLRLAPASGEAAQVERDCK